MVTPQKMASSSPLFVSNPSENNNNNKNYLTTTEDDIDNSKYKSYSSTDGIYGKEAPAKHVTKLENEIKQEQSKKDNNKSTNINNNNKPSVNVIAPSNKKQM